MKKDIEKTANRRAFLKNGLAASAGILTGMESIDLLASAVIKKEVENNFYVKIPLPVQVVIDDVGWWSGHDGSKQQEPFRTGINRNHVPADYAAIVELAKALEIRPQAAIVLCEWDKENILRQLPTATWMGNDWDNSRWVGEWMEEAAGIIRENEQYIELTLHGVGHEYWENGRFTRAEWADENGWMRPQEQVEKHLNFFEKIMQQHQLGSFPDSFVPTAFLHGFGRTPGHKTSMAEILSKRGIKYINTPFHSMYNANAINHTYFGFDSDVLTIDRGKDVLPWNATGIPPAGRLQGPTCGMHWANLIHPDPKRNSEIVQSWVEFLMPYRNNPGTMLASDSVSFQSQLLYHASTELIQKGNNILFDFRKTDSFQDNKLKNTFTLKIQNTSDIHVTSDSLKVVSQSSARSDGYFVSTIKLERIPDAKTASLRILN